jgi:hypothetical protein
LGAGSAVIALTIGLARLSDNSVFTHLATGRLIWEQGAVPSTDPYSFTAAGTPWVVQSWLASVLMAGFERLMGPDGVRVLTGLLAAALGALSWRLTRPARSLLMRTLLTGFVLVLGSTFWSPRPLLFGLVAMAMALVITEEDRDPRWLAPLFWVWVNTHGSFPLGLVALGALAVGAHFDGPEDRRHSRRRGLLWAGVGTLAGVVSPLGLHALTFPVTVLGRSSILGRVVEWQSPKFAAGYSRVFLAQVLLAVLALVRVPRWRIAIPLVVFTAAALLGLRNIPVASLVLLPGMAWGVRDIGSLRGQDRGLVPSVLAGLTAVVAGVVVLGALNRPSFDLRTYPVDAVAWMDTQSLTAGRARVFHTDTTGNYLELLYGDRAGVFLDDRVDMYPIPVLEDYLELNDGAYDWPAILDRHRVDVVMWSRGSPLSVTMAETASWRVIYSDRETVVSCRRVGTDALPDPTGALGGCRRLGS